MAPRPPDDQRLGVRIAIPAPGDGHYSYLCNGKPAGIEESFSVRAGTGSNASPVTVRSQRRAPGGVHLEVTADVHDERNARCELTYSDGTGTTQSCSYVLEDGSLRVSPALHVEPPAGAVLSPLMRVFQGPAISEVLGAGGRSTVVVPSLDPGDPEGLFAPTLQDRSATAARADRDGFRLCRYTGGNYDSTAAFWLDDEDRLVRYEFPQSPDQHWEVTLSPNGR